MHPLPVKETSTRANAAPTSASCRSRGARARVRSNRLHGPATGSRIRSPLSSGLCGSIALFPSRSAGALLARRHSHEVPDELGHLPPRRRPASAGPSSTRGARLVTTPVHSTDVCSSRLFFQRMTTLRLGTLRIAFPHAIRELSVPRRCARFGEPTRTYGAYSSPHATFRRPSDASSLRGLPRQIAMRPPASARGSSTTIPGSYPRA